MGEVRQGASAAAVTLLYSAAKFKALFSAYDRVDMTSLFDLPDCALEHVFGNLRAATLLTVLALVNKRCWSIVRSQVLWLDRLPPVLLSQLRGTPGSSSGGGHGAIALPVLHPRLFHTNLLQNPWLSLEEQMAARRSAGGDAAGRAKTPWLAIGGSMEWGAGAMEGLTVEPGGEPPQPPAPLPPFSQAGPVRRPAGAVASSYTQNTLVQVVDLVAELQQRGLTREAACAFLDSGPPLDFSVFVAGRFDAPGIFRVHLLLDGGQGGVPVAPLLFNEFMGRCPCVWGLGLADAPTMRWERQGFSAAGYLEGMRRAVVVLAGQSRVFWAGHYGAKFCSPCLRFVDISEKADACV